MPAKSPLPADAVFLALDAGNSSTKAAVWGGVAWGPVAVFPSDEASPAVWAERLRPLAPDGLSAGNPVAGLASVVPTLNAALAEGVRLAMGSPPALVSAHVLLPFRMSYRTPDTLGADRIAAAAAAWSLAQGRPVVAVDAGTAVTLDVVDVDADGSTYLGGAIAPGPDLLVRALARGTGALPEVVFGAPASAIGGTTEEAIAAGVAGLFQSGVAGLLARTCAAMSAPPLVVVTGGWAAWLVAGGLPADLVVPTLVLDGVRLLCSPDDGPARGLLATGLPATGAAATLRRG